MARKRRQTSEFELAATSPSYWAHIYKGTVTYQENHLSFRPQATKTSLDGRLASNSAFPTNQKNIRQVIQEGQRENQDLPVINLSSGGT